jgi:hypothetical protein
MTVSLGNIGPLLVGLLIFILVIVKNLRGKELTWGSIVTMPIAFIIIAFNDVNNASLAPGAIHEFLVCAVLSIIEGIVLGMLNIVTEKDGKFWIKSSIGYIISWVVVIAVRAIVKRVFFGSIPASQTTWVFAAYMAIYQVIKSVVLFIRHQDAAHYALEQHRKERAEKEARKNG